MKKKIYYHDTDCGGVVYYANYLKYLEEARTEFMAERGVIIGELHKESFLFAVKSVDIQYKSPAKYGDVLKIETELEKTKQASFVFRQSVLRGKEVLAEADTVLVCINAEFKPQVIPPEVVKSLTENAL